MDPGLSDRFETLKTRLRDLGAVLVAFSGEIGRAHV